MKSASIMGVVTSLVVLNFDIECDGSLSFILLLLVVFEHLRVFVLTYLCGFELFWSPNIHMHCKRISETVYLNT